MDMGGFCPTATIWFSMIPNTKPAFHPDHVVTDLWENSIHHVKLMLAYQEAGMHKLYDMHRSVMWSQTIMTHLLQNMDSCITRVSCPQQLNLASDIALQTAVNFERSSSQQVTPSYNVLNNA